MMRLDESTLNEAAQGAIGLSLDLQCAATFEDSAQADAQAICDTLDWLDEVHGEFDEVHAEAFLTAKLGSQS